MSAPRVGAKSPAAFRTISEVSDELDVPQHVLRFWETKFTQVRPMKRAGGRRYYRPEDVELLRRIRDLLYNDGYTIKGVQRLLRETRGKALPAVATAPAASSAGAVGSQGSGSSGGRTLDPALRQELEGLLHELEALRHLIRGTKSG